MRDIAFRPAGPSDARAIASLLDGCGLPHEDIDLNKQDFLPALAGEKAVCMKKNIA